MHNIRNKLGAFRLPLLLSLIMLILNACSTVHMAMTESRGLLEAGKMVPAAGFQRSSRWTLPANAHVYLARNGYMNSSQPGAGAALTDALERSLQANFAQVRVGIYPESVEASMRTASMTAHQYLVYPHLLVWDDRNSTWTEIFSSLRNQSNEQIVEGIGLDRVSLKLTIYDVTTGNQIDRVQIEASSGLLGMYGDKPPQLLAPALNSYFSALVAQSL